VWPEERAATSYSLNLAYSGTAFGGNTTSGNMMNHVRGRAATSYSLNLAYSGTAFGGSTTSGNMMNHVRRRDMAASLMNQAADPLLIDVREVARLTALSPRTIWQLTNDGKLRAVRIGRSVRYDPADLRLWIDSQKAAAEAA
jgi:excisionase family DNA binding protein